MDTLNEDLLRLLDWLTGAGCTHVALESTGVYWKPVFNLLAGVLDPFVAAGELLDTIPGIALMVISRRGPPNETTPWPAGFFGDRKGGKQGGTKFN